MKKVLVLAALVSTVLASGAAMAYPIGAAHPVNVNIGLPLNSGSLTAFGAFNQPNVCLYPAVWSSPFNLGNQVSCGLTETKTATFPNCQANAAVYRPGSLITTLPGGCAGFDPNGTQYLNSIVIAAFEGLGGASGVISYPAPFGGPYPVSL